MILIAKDVCPRCNHHHEHHVHAGMRESEVCPSCNCVLRHSRDVVSAEDYERAKLAGSLSLYVEGVYV